MQRFLFEKKKEGDISSFRLSTIALVVLTVLIMVVAVIVMHCCKQDGQQYMFSDYFDVFNMIFWIMIAAKCISLIFELKSRP